MIVTNQKDEIIHPTRTTKCDETRYHVDNILQTIKQTERRELKWIHLRLNREHSWSFGLKRQGYFIRAALAMMPWFALSDYILRI